MLRRQAGFTLFEVLLVAVLLALLALLVFPDLRGTSRGEQLDESVARLKALIAMTRAEAMNQTRRYCLTFRQDGSIRLSRQRDPLTAPHEFVRVRAPWALREVLLPEVWVAAIEPLPQGPAPILVQDDRIEFAQLESEPVPVTELEAPHQLYFEPDGTCPSMRWILRDETGRGRLVTLDGRTGRLTAEPAAVLSGRETVRPGRLAEPKEEDETDRLGQRESRT
jgi:type II secretion system protein H